MILINKREEHSATQGKQTTKLKRKQSLSILYLSILSYPLIDNIVIHRDVIHTRAYTKYYFSFVFNQIFKQTVALKSA